jgi:O-antigen ligase
MERSLLWGLICLLAAAPLPFGAVQPWASAALSAGCLALGALWVVWRSRRGLTALPWRDPILWAGALLLSVAALQLLPLPGSWVAAASPESAQLRARYEPADTGADSVSATVGPAAGSTWRTLSLHPWAGRREALALAGCLLAALVTLDLTKKPGTRRIVGAAIAASGAFQAVYGLAEYFSDRQHIFGFAKKYYTEVVTGTFINRNHFAGYMEMSLPLAVALGALAMARAKGGTDRSAGRALFLSGIVLVSALVMLTALVCSRSRMGIVCVVLSLVGASVILAWRGRTRAFLVASVLVVAVAGLLVGHAGAGTPLLRRFTCVLDDATARLGRWSIWVQSAGMAAAFPMTGSGLGTYPHVIPVFRTQGEGVRVQHAHNDFLEFAAETGALGCAAALAGALLVGADLRRRLRIKRPESCAVGAAAAAGAASIALHSLADFNMQIPANALTLAVLAGMSLAWLRGPAPVLAVDNAPAPRRRMKGWLPAAALLVGAGSATAPALPAPGTDDVSGDAPERLSRLADDMGGSALRDLEILAGALGAGEPPSPVALDYVRQRLLGAIDLGRRSLRGFPLSSDGHLLLGRLQMGECAVLELAGEGRDDCVDPALESIRKTLELNPMSASAHIRAARLIISTWPLLSSGRRDACAAIIDRAVEMEGKNSELGRSWRALRAEAVQDL